MVEKAVAIAAMAMEATHTVYREALCKWLKNPQLEDQIIQYAVVQLADMAEIIFDSAKTIEEKG